MNRNSSLLNELFDALPYSISYVDREGRYQFCNKACEQMIGISREYLKGELITDVLLQEAGKELISSVDKVLRSQKEICYVRMERGGKENSVFLEVKILPFFGSLNEFKGVLVFEKDITLQRKIELELKQQLSVAKKSQEDVKSYLENIISRVPANVYWKDKKGVILGDNLNHAKMAGFKSQDEVIGKTDYDFPWKDQADRIRKNDLNVIKTGLTQQFEETAVLSDGTKNIFLTTKAPLYNASNEITGIIGISINITDRKELEWALKVAKEKAEAASQAKSEFIANMSHDIRTPMTGILGMLQEMLSTVDAMNIGLESMSALSRENLLLHIKDFVYNTQKHTNIALESANELLRLSNEILELSRLESGKADVVKEVFSLPEVVEHNRGLLQSVATHKKLDFIVEVSDRIPPCLRGSRQYFDRILLNIISNALKFTEVGYVKVLVRLVDDVPSENYKKGDKVTLQIVIEDTGIGIPKEHFEKIFEHFSRLSASYEGVYKGSGLGLYTVKHYVQAMGGRISVESVIGKGSCFTLTLPFTVEDFTDYKQLSTRLRTPLYVEPSILPVSDCSVAFKSETKTKSPTSTVAEILIVEDNPTAALAEQMILERLSCQVDIAKNGAQAIEKASHHTYDLIFMDVGLPDISGLEVTQKIRALSDHKKSRVPIVALTGHIGENEYETCLEAGMNEVLTKPPQVQALKSTLERWVWLPRMANPKDLPVIDWENSLAMCWGDKVMLHSFLSGLVVDLKETQRIIMEACPAKEVKKLREEVHRCLSGMTFLKLPQLERAIKNLQSALQEEPFDSDAFEKKYVIFEEALQAFWEFAKKEGWDK